MSAEYLFMTDKLYDINYDTGDKVIQCGRHNDIFKLWLQWRSKVCKSLITTIACAFQNYLILFLKGTEGFEQHMDRLIELTQYQVRKIKAQPDKFYLIMEPECVNVLFWYIPKRLRGMPHDSRKEIELGKVILLNVFIIFIYVNRFQSFKICPIIKGRMMQAGTLMVGYQPDDRRPNFFRSIISSGAVTEKDVDFMLSEFDRLGQDL